MLATAALRNSPRARRSDAVVLHRTGVCLPYQRETIVPDHAISFLALRPYAGLFQAALDWSGRYFGVTSAVITLDLVTRQQRAEERHAVDWIGLTALIAGPVA